MSNISRSVRASTRSKRLRGHDTLPASGPGGTIFHFEEVGERDALTAFDAVVRDPGVYEIITRDGTRVAFLIGGGIRGVVYRVLRRPIDSVTLDIWFEEEPEPPLLDVYAVSPASARAFVESVYQDLSDAELWRRLDLPLLAT